MSRLFFILILLFYGLSSFSQNHNTYFLSSPYQNAFLPKLVSLDENQNIDVLWEAQGDSIYDQELILVHADNLYGICKRGGRYNYGGIFQLDLQSKSFKILYNFKEDELIKPVSMSYDSGSIWIASWGPSFNGNIFKFDQLDDTLIQVFSFDDSFGFFTNGNLPVGKLQFKDNKVFGLTMFGGGLEVDHINQMSFPFRGTIFSIDKTTYNFQKLITFNPGNPWGNYPSGSLTKDKEAYIFQMYRGGILRYNSNSNSLSKIKEFQNNLPDEERLIGDIHLLKNRYWGIYINEQWGQNNDFGSIYSVNDQGEDFRIHHSFESELIKDNEYYINHYVVSGEIERHNYTIYSDGNDLFGVIKNFKNSGKNVLFKFDPELETYTLLNEFNSNISTQIEFWNDKLILKSTGTKGGIIQVDPVTGDYSYIYRFSTISISRKTKLLESNEHLYFVSLHTDDNSPGVINRINKFSGEKEGIYSFRNIESVETSKIHLFENSLFGFVNIIEQGLSKFALFEYDFLSENFEIIHVFNDDLYDSDMRFSKESLSFYKDKLIYAYEEKDNNGRLDYYPIIRELDLIRGEDYELKNLQGMEQNPWIIQSLIRDDEYIYGIGGISGIIFSVHINSGKTGLINFFGYNGDNGLYAMDTVVWAVHRGRLLAYNSSMDSILYNPNQWKDSVCHPEFNAFTMSRNDDKLLISSYYEHNTIYEFDTDSKTCTDIITLDPLLYGRVNSNFIFSGNPFNENQSDEIIRIFPNPATATLFFYKRINVKIEEIQVYQLTGQLTQKISLQNSLDQTIDISGLRPGMYILRFTGPSFYEAHKFVKQ
ncbi:T9SS type A sorting domain-containing protein [Hyphobacterium sp. CCMP332]|nr:T9SS type A sorting domain-containing protein [Hyphobacterium sp. CCMP332]